uniref:Uncharacterized protein n=1 Tax=Anguilla anguilla TaxID=7936 RepID=A0A0E9WI39_ANGAN
MLGKVSLTSTLGPRARAGQHQVSWPRTTPGGCLFKCISLCGFHGVGSNRSARCGLCSKTKLAWCLCHVFNPECVLSSTLSTLFGLY